MLAGDWSAKVVAKTQPVKLAAMEGQVRDRAPGTTEDRRHSRPCHAEDFLRPRIPGAPVVSFFWLFSTLTTPK